MSPAGAQLLPGPAEPPRPRQTPPPVPSASAPQSPGPGPFLGSTTAGTARPEELSLSLSEAIARGLKYNLGLLLSEQGREVARAGALRSLSARLPNVTSSITESGQQVNLAAFGLPPFPGVPRVIGPFQLFDARAFFTTPVVDMPALASQRAQRENERAAQLSYQDARDLVVLTVINLYLQAIAGNSRIDSARAQLATAEALYKQAVDLKSAGVAAGIDLIRADVERQAQQQRLIFFQNEWEKEKLRLARAIGLPLEQRFRLADQIPYAPPPTLTPEQALTQSYKSRADYQSALAAVRGAELARKAAAAQRYPAVDFNANYGVIGPRIDNSHGTFTAAGAVRLPIFQGGRIQAEVVQAEAVLAQQRLQADDLRGRIGFEVRSALLDLNASSDQVKVARSAVDLANQQLAQARDRFAAGIVNSLEVVQSQESLATANDNYISALYAYNTAKASLARALGNTEETAKQLLGVR